MAENLGTIDIAVKSDSKQIEKSFEDGGQKAGKSIGDSLSSILGRVLGGAGHVAGSALGGVANNVFGQGRRFGPKTKYDTKFGGAMQTSMGGSRVAMIAGTLAKVALVVGAVAVLGIAIKKVITHFINFGKKVEAMAHKFARVNAQLAVLSAQKKLSQLSRDMDMAEKLAPTITMVSSAMSKFKNAMQPLTQLFTTLKSVLSVEVIGLVTDIAGIITSWLQLLSPLIKMFAIRLRILARVIRIAITSMMSPLMFMYKTFTGQNSDLFDMKTLIAEMSETHNSIDKILFEIREAKDDKLVDNWNSYIGDMGVQLSGGQWNPFGARHQIANASPIVPKTQPSPSPSKARHDSGMPF